MSFDYNLHVFHSPKFQSVVNDAITFFDTTPVHVLPPPGQFIGPGVYGLYYHGGYEAYTRIATRNQDTYLQPIYIGKAVPPGWRTGRGSTSSTPDVYRRLREHANSIQQVANLRIDDFRCRFMILSNIESDLVVPVEAELIRRHKPLWNTVVDGFGNHDPGKGRYNQSPSEWDVLHPGRSWAGRLTGTPPEYTAIIAKIQNFLDLLPLP